MNDLGEVKLSPAFGGVKITTEPSGAEIYIAGRKRGLTPWFATEVASGAYLISLRKNLFHAIENLRLIVEDGKIARIHHQLEKNFGEIILQTEPSRVTATIINAEDQIVMKKNTSETDSTIFQLSPGNYRLKLEKENYDPLAFKISLAKNSRQSITKQQATLRRQGGFLVVSTKPFTRGAEVWVNGIKKATVPANLALLTGEYDIEVKHKGKSGKEKVLIRDGESQTLILELKEQSSGDFVFVKGGCYQMGDTFGEGDSDEKPVHQVCVDGFYLGKYEVPQGEWQKVMGNNPSRFKNGNNYPVEKVSWEEVQTFISQLNRQTDGKYRLPTEAEWEYACREGGKSVKYGTGKNSLDSSSARFNSGATVKVGSYQPNALGLYDMSGNVWEWVSDRYNKNYYGNSPGNNPTGPGSGSDRVRRGGSWDIIPGTLRCAFRGRGIPVDRIYILGFRLLRTP